MRLGRRGTKSRARAGSKSSHNWRRGELGLAARAAWIYPMDAMIKVQNLTDTTQLLTAGCHVPGLATRVRPG